MEFDLNQLVNGGWPVWVALAGMILLMARGNKDLGISNLLIELLTQLLNGPDTHDHEKKADRARSLVKLSEHCRDCGNDKIAEQLLMSLPAIIAHKKKEVSKGAF